MRAKRLLFLGLGSNLGDRLENLGKARNGLVRELGPEIAASQLYETAAWGKTDQSDFLNQVILLHCNLEPKEVLQKALAQELALGRIRGEKWDARLIDIDLLFYGDLCMETKDLTLPHPFISQRRFILAPLAEIAPHFMHPILNKNLRSLFQQCEDQSAVNIYVP